MVINQEHGVIRKDYYVDSKQRTREKYQEVISTEI